LTAALREQTEKAEKLDRIIWANVEDIGYMADNVFLISHFATSKTTGG